MGTRSSLKQLVADELRAHMARKKKTGVELASVLQISQQAASRRMLGEVSLDLDELVLVADWLEVDFLDLLPASVVARTAVPA